MPRQIHLTPEFIELAPSELKEGVLYVSMVHACVIHRVAAGAAKRLSRRSAQQNGSFPMTAKPFPFIHR